MRLNFPVWCQTACKSQDRKRTQYWWQSVLLNGRLYCLKRTEIDCLTAKTENLFWKKKLESKGFFILERYKKRPDWPVLWIKGRISVMQLTDTDWRQTPSYCNVQKVMYHTSLETSTTKLSSLFSPSLSWNDTVKFLKRYSKHISRFHKSNNIYSNIKHHIVILYIRFLWFELSQ